jgi:hypothetical protein
MHSSSITCYKDNSRPKHGTKPASTSTAPQGSGNPNQPPHNTATRQHRCQYKGQAQPQGKLIRSHVFKPAQNERTRCYTEHCMVLGTDLGGHECFLKHLVGRLVCFAYSMPMRETLWSACILERTLLEVRVPTNPVQPTDSSVVHSNTQKQKFNNSHARKHLRARAGQERMLHYMQSLFTVCSHRPQKKNELSTSGQLNSARATQPCEHSLQTRAPSYVDAHRCARLPRHRRRLKPPPPRRRPKTPPPRRPRFQSSQKPPNEHRGPQCRRRTPPGLQHTGCPPANAAVQETGRLWGFTAQLIPGGAYFVGRK